MEGSQPRQHGQADQPITVTIHDHWGQPRRLPAEHQIIARAKPDLMIIGPALGAEKIKVGAGVLGKKRLEIRVGVHQHLIPIVQPRPADLAGVEGKAQGLNEDGYKRQER